MKEVFVRLERCQGCKSCEMACAVAHSDTKSLISAISEKPRPKRLIYVESAEGQKVPLLCRHCVDAPCVAVCRTGAMHQDPITGIVDRRIENCVGCWMCAMICPYGVIQALPSVRIASKCDRCKDLDVPACVQACPVKALVFATPDEFSQKLRSEAAAKIAREAKQLAKA